MKITENVSLQHLNTFGVAAKARYYCRLATVGGLKTVLLWQREHPDLPVLFLGGGSNLLFIDDFPGLVVQVKLRERMILGEDEHYVYVRAGAGENWHAFVRWTVEQGYAGLENLSLIPGTVGAAPVQNIGAYGVELQDTVHAVQAVDWRTAELRHFSREACEFAYRDSYFKSVEPGRWLIVAVTFRLPKQAEWQLDYAGVREALGDKVLTPELLTPKTISDAIMAIRQSKLADPAVLGNAGSFFKNPLVSAEKYAHLQLYHPHLPAWPQAAGKVKLSAAWLVEQCGWKGQRQGDAGTYDKHALVLVNYGQASGLDLWQFARAIMESVQARFGIALEAEPRIIT
ncbi:MAG: UDP-N-acetylenolpyruvoylglucosamine reductase [Proteobacteria bacterium]|nr:MAG: UDP-N-acetylenolpyruvoylglucosamine reductase [Pseudomonadota bacterium]